MVRVTIEVNFIGRVQGVGFRWFVRSEANKRGVTGWVHNEPQRDLVSAVFQGERKEVLELIEATKRALFWMRVDSVSMQEQKSSEVFRDFKIKY